MSKATGLNGLRLTVQAIMQMLRKKADKDKVVSSVNGAGPDENGNVQVQVGVTSWNELEDKPFYCEEEILLNFPDVNPDVPFYDQDDTFPGWTATQTNVAEWVMTASFPDLPAPADLIGAKILYHSAETGADTVVEITADCLMNDGEYVQTSGLDSVVIRNTGEVQVTLVGNAANYKVSYYPVCLYFEEIKQLDPKFIPSLEVTITMGMDGTIASSHTGAEINAAALNGAAIVATCKAPGTDGEMTFPLGYGGCAQNIDGSAIAFYAVFTMYAYADSLTGIFLIVEPEGTTVTHKQFTWG